MSTQPTTNTTEKQGQAFKKRVSTLRTIACRVPEEVRRDFHAACIYKGKTMNTVLMDFIKTTIAGSKGSIKLLLAGIAGFALLSSANAQDSVHPLLKTLVKPTQTQVPAAPSAPAPVNAAEAVSNPALPPAPVAPPVSTPAPVAPVAPVAPSVSDTVPVAPSLPKDPTPAPVNVTPEPIKASPVTAIVPTSKGESMRVTLDQLELGKISRTVSTAELKKLDPVLVATEKRKPINVTVGGQTVKLEVPIIGYLLQEKKVTPSPLAIPVASADAGYKFSDTDMRNLKIMYNAILEKASANVTTSERFREVLKGLENYIRDLDNRKQAADEQN